MLTVEDQIRLIADAAMDALDLDTGAERRATPRETVLDPMPVADTSSPGQFTEEVVTMIDVKTTGPAEPRQKRPMRVLVAGILAAAAVVAIAFVMIRDADDVTPVDQPSTTVTVPTTPLPRPLHIDRSPSGDIEPGTYYVDEINGTPTPRIFVTVGAGWSDHSGGTDLWAIMLDHLPSAPGQIGFVTVSRAVTVFADACHPSGGYHQGPVTNLDDLVAALTEQQGWAEVTTPTNISIDGYAGKAFQRIAPTDMTDCDREARSNTRVPRVDDGEMGYPNFKSWEIPDGIGAGDLYERGQIETLWVVDLDGTVVVIATELWPTPRAAAHTDFADAVLDSIRIDRG
jgi:hypothetical protein